MKLRQTIFLAAISLFLGACNFTLAQDVTPPPDYIAPSPAPTLGPLYPASAPDTANGAVIYAEKCTACHGETGLGDGEQGKQLPNKVAALGLPDFAQKAKPSDWFVAVTNGNLNRFMPPFVSLDDQERWDVVAYAYSLHTTPAQIELGKSLFETNCAGCAEKFKNLEMMSALSENDLIQIIKDGKNDVPAFGKEFSDDEARAVAMYLRTLTFAEILPTPTAGTDTETPVSAEVIPAVGFGKVSGTVENQSGVDLPAEVRVTLSGFDHNTDTTSTPQEVVTLEGTIHSDGTFVFENVEIPENRIFIARVSVNGMTYQSEFAVVEAGMQELTLSPVIIYASTEDTSALKIESLQMYFDFASQDVVQMFAVYSITNTGSNSVIINMGDSQTVPFIGFPAGMEKLGYEAAQESAPFVPIDNGFAMPPSINSYGLIAFASVAKTKEINISQPALLPINGLTLFLPEGVEAKDSELTDGGIQTVQSTNFHVYTASGIGKNESYDFILTGRPKTTEVNPDVTQNKTLLIGVGAFGIVLILAGIWMFMRDRKRVEERDDQDPDSEFDDPESIMDSIITLDDLHRDGKLAEQAYQTRRNELKNALKRKS